MHGAGAITVLRRITVRLAWPGILAAAIYIFMTAFAAFDVPAIIGWGNRIFTFTTYLYLLLNPQDSLPRYGLGAALSTVAMAIAALMSWWYGAMQRRSRRFAVVTGTGLSAEDRQARPPPPGRMGLRRRLSRARQGAADRAAGLELAAAVLPASLRRAPSPPSRSRIISRCPGSWC